MRDDGDSMAGGARQRGFTLFELVAYILVVSITVSVAYNRFADFPGEAERANFLAIMMQLKAGVTLQMMDGIAGGDFQELGALQGSNPMDLMLETPVNYLGEFSMVDRESMPRRVWYFDTSRGELVYLANDARNLSLVVNGEAVPTDELRFHIQAEFAEPETRQNWQGLLLKPVQPYHWERVELEIPAVQVQ